MKLTRIRKKLLEYLNRADSDISAQELHKEFPDIDLATIYRNLNLFVENELVKELRFDKSESTYEINNDGHDHAICSDCGKVRHITIDKSKLKKVLDLDDFEVEDIEINIRGRCKD